MEDEEEEKEEVELVDIVDRGLMDPSQRTEIKQCLGGVRNMLLTAITTRPGFDACVRRTCPNFSSEQLDGVASCLNLQLGLGPGPKCDWHDYWAKEKYMIMNNRGRLGFCLREQRQKC